MPLAPAGRGLVLEQHLEPILQRSHIRIPAALELETLRDDLDGPAQMRGVLASLEAEKEVAREIRVDAKGIHRTLWVGGGVGSQPLFCAMC
jgi:hypothetical protein